MSGKLIPYVAAAALVFAGCESVIRLPTEVCPGKGSVADALAALQSQSQNIVPLQAKGQCRLEYFVEGKNKKQRESLDIKLWANPPAEIYFQGDKPLVPKAVVLGSNQREFWLSISPKEISTHWWGQWSQQGSSEVPLINPKTLLESLGIGETDQDQDWSLDNEGAFDVLTKRQRGVITKKVYIYACDYRVRQIEFFDSEGRAVVLAELDKYQEVSRDFFVPTLIKLTAQGRGSGQDSFSIHLGLESIKPADISQPQRKYLFERRPPKGFKHVRRIVNGKWVEEPQ
jgi:hypothetical protein